MMLLALACNDVLHGVQYDAMFAHYAARRNIIYAVNIIAAGNIICPQGQTSFGDLLDRRSPNGGFFAYLMKFVHWDFSFSGKPNFSLPSAMLRIKNTMLLASVRMPCRPSASCSHSPGFAPCTLFQY